VAGAGAAVGDQQIRATLRGRVQDWSNEAPKSREPEVRALCLGGGRQQCRHPLIVGRQVFGTIGHLPHHKGRLA
jgi:hypothetical protein